MCGISVVLDRAGSLETTRRLVRMHELIPHRGPDAQGFLLVEPGGGWTRRSAVDAELTTSPALLGMASRRLSILDPTAASDQPMGSPDGSLWVVFNGEIYNFREVRDELRALGHTFRTSGDTEVVLVSFDAWGEKCFERLDGAWAIAIADLPRQRLVVSRDRLGIKPLYWATDGSALLLASEIKQIVGVTPGRPRAHAPLVRMFLGGVRLPCLEETFFAHVRSVPPAVWFEVPLADTARPTLDFHRYWDLSAFYCATPECPAQTYPEALEEFGARLRGAVDSHAVADVPVGSLLSGGLDSSTMSHLLVERLKADGKACPTFSFGFRERAPEVCELRYVDAMLRRGGLVNYQTTLDADWIMQNVSKVFWALEEPALSLAVLAQYRIFQFCREHGMTVIVDSLGPDELLGGYPYNQRTLLVDRLRKGRAADFLREWRAIRRVESVGSLALFAHGFLRPAVRRYRRRHSWLKAEYGVRVDRQELLEAQRDTGHDPSLVNRRAYYDAKWGNIKILLGYGDKSAMAHSVAVRVPYLDRKLVEFAFSLPDHYKVSGGERKRLLRDVARALVPREILERRDRMGFGVPAGALVRGIWPSVREVIGDDRFVASACFDPARIRRFLGDFEAGRHEDVPAIWRLYAFALWSHEFDVALG